MAPRIVPESFIRPSPRRGGRSQKGLCKSCFLTMSAPRHPL